ncbi:MAG: prepilin-type N-terminal cleavage/methylation domain-containing protein [Brevinematales bacterium]|nr:prepilin-type N-terminal cleavage/methylation domain-containing protein [Brevinematales bacterium]
MLMKFIRRLLENRKGFSIIEVIVAVFIISVVIFSVVEAYRYVVFASLKARDLKDIFENSKNLYLHLLEDKDFYKVGSLKTNIQGCHAEIRVIKIYSTNPPAYDVFIRFTNEKNNFSFITTVY